MLFPSLFFITGLFLLYAGAESFIKGASSFALLFGVSPLVIGLTIASIATSSPELFVSVEAALQNQGNLAMGNIIGSNIANIGLILAISSIIFPIKVEKSLFRKEIPLMIGATLLTVSTVHYFQRFGRGFSLFFLFLGIVYTAWLIFLTKKEERNLSKKEWGFFLSLIASFIGLLFLILGAKSLVYGATEIGKHFGLSEAVLGLTVVAVGTSLPELATCIVGAVRGRGDFVIGNVIGSNIYNLLLILPIAALVKPLELADFSFFSLGVVLFFSILLLPFLYTRFIVTRGEGLLLFLFYFCYIFLLY